MGWILLANTLKCKSILYFILYMAVLYFNIQHSRAELENLPYCGDKVPGKISRGQLYISTLDGKLTALNLLNGKLEWITKTGTGPLVSSSLHSLEMVHNRQLIRFIPSLNGDIYKFDGERISRTSVTADDLLSSSFKFSDNLVIVGGKEARSYGISIRTGKILYECSMQGCLNNNQSKEGLSSNLHYIIDKDISLLDEVIVVKHETKTVRAIEPISGVEHWNFSVGQHELQLIKNNDCHDFNFSELDLVSLNLHIKVSVGEDMSTIYAFSKNSDLLWKYELNIPIANMWRTDLKDNLQSINIFDLPNCIGNVDNSNFEKPDLVLPSIFLGVYQNQLYVHESIGCQKISNHFPIDTGDGIPYKLLGKSKDEIQLKSDRIVDIVEEYGNGRYGKNTIIDKCAVIEKVKNVSATALSLFYPTKSINILNTFHFNIGREINNTEYPFVIDMDNTSVEIIIISLWFWWKEIIVISLTTALIINLFLPKIHRSREILVIERHIPVPTAIEAIEEPISSTTSENSKNSITNSNNSDVNFVSRFQLDFDVISCIGKGGYGVVYEAKNKLDDCNYAVKKIVLPNKKEKRKRVMREVKTLAKCEHHNIVRYFQAWIECPPPNWEESINICRGSELGSMECESMNETAMSSQNSSEIEIIDRNNSSLSSLMQNNSKKNISTSSSLLPVLKSSNLINFEEKDYQNSSIDSIEIKFEQSNQQSNIDLWTSSSYSKSSKDDYRNKHNFDNNSDIAKIPYDKRDLKSIDKEVLFQTNQNKIYLYIQMQLCRKQSLHDWLRCHVLDARTPCVQNFFEEIVDAVDYVHQKGLIHRDLKPSNIFFSQNGQIKIGDFGLVALMPSEGNSKSNYENLDFKDPEFVNSLYKHTGQVGTYLYMSPEQLKGKPYDYRVDIYSLGFIFFEMLFYFSTEMERITTLMELRKGKYPKNFKTRFPEEFLLLNQMLSNEPKRRPNAEKIKETLLNMISWAKSKCKSSNQQTNLNKNKQIILRNETYASL